MRSAFGTCNKKKTWWWRFCQTATQTMVTGEDTAVRWAAVLDGGPKRGGGGWGGIITGNYRLTGVKKIQSTERGRMLVEDVAGHMAF
jgi:hypothetical protein